MTDHLCVNAKVAPLLSKIWTICAIVIFFTDMVIYLRTPTGDDGGTPSAFDIYTCLLPP